MKDKYLKQLSIDEHRIYSLLKSLNHNERIIGTLVMARLGIKDKRRLYQLIENMRNIGIPIIGSKHQGDKGYKLARNPMELTEYLITCESTITTQLQTLEAMKLAASDIF